MKLAAYPKRKRGRIEIIPLIDIVFFLLATFVMVSLSMQKHRGMMVNLPDTVSSDAEAAQEDEVSITVAKDGTIYWDKDVVAPQELRLRLESLFRSAPQTVVALQGDEDAKLGKVVTILDDLRQIGLTNIAIRTEVKSSGGA